MARNHWTLANSAKVTLTGGVAKTILQVISPSGMIEAVQMIEITFDGTSNTAIPAQVDLLRQTTSGAGTGLSPGKIKDTATALNLTARENLTVEPAAGQLLHTWFVHPQAGVIHELTLPDGEVEIPGSTATSGLLGLRVNAPAGVDVLGTIRGEE